MTPPRMTPPRMTGARMTDDPLAACLGGHLTPAMAVARLLLAGESPSAIRRRLAALPPAPVREELETLARLDLERLADMLRAAGVDHAGPATPAAIAAVFDKAVAVSPEASVALYSLGDPGRLAAATAEIVDWLAATELIGPAAAVLDLGCGIGRVAAALAPRVTSVLGLDVSAGMIRMAAARCAGLANVRCAVSGGTDLGGLPDGGFDLVLAVDSFPYLLQAGVADRHVAEAHRVLRPGGALAVLNLSYRADPAADRRTAAAWAQAAGFTLALAGAAPFRLWDGRAFVLRRG
jgi:SAM-dependent methyltransferase